MLLVVVCVWAGLAKEHTFEEPGSQARTRAAQMDQSVTKTVETATFALG